MAWVKVETRFIDHPKVVRVGAVGEALWLRGLCYSGEHMTDGFIPDNYIRRMGDIDGNAVADVLVASELWDRVDGGYQIHDYLEWQSSREHIEEVRAKRVESGSLGGKQRASKLLQESKQSAKQNPSKHSSKTGENPSKNVPEDRSKKVEGKTQKKEYTNAFDEWWSIWPKRGDTKRAAFDRWESLSD
jgi:hypothetical protein